MLVIAAVALMLSGGVTYLAYRVLQSRLRPPEETVNVVVAAKPLPMGIRLTAEDLQLSKGPKSAPLQGSFSDPKAAIGRALLIPTQINEPILESKLASKEGGAGLMAVIPEGMRALTIQVNSIIGVSGFVVPGARVDMILTATPPKDAKGAKNDEMGSKIVLENLEVLAAGQNVQREVDGKPQSVQDVTLLLTPEQTERVALATGDGRIQLALRNPLDKEAIEPPLIVRSTLYAGPTTAEPNPKGTAEANTKDAKVKPKPQEQPRPQVSSAAIIKRPAPPRALPAVAPPPPEPAKPKIIAVELIQGARRATQNFEEKKSEEKKIEEKKIEEKKS